MTGPIKCQDDSTRRVSGKAQKKPYGADVFPASPSNTAAYIHDIAHELQLMARRAELTFLSYLLEMASQEAEYRKHLGSGQKGS